jgi:hypothetical protein
MVDEIVRHNWVETALNEWGVRRFSGEVTISPKRQLLNSLVQLMFSNEVLLRSDANWVDLSTVRKENFFDVRSKKLIESRIDKALSKALGARKIAYDCLRAAYDQGFDLNEKMTPQPAPKRDKSQRRKPAQKPKGQDLTEIWAKATFEVFKENKELKKEDYPSEEDVKTRIKDIIGKLERDFGEVSYKRFTTDDDVMEATDEFLETELKEAATDHEVRMIAALQVAITRLPAPK